MFNSSKVNKLESVCDISGMMMIKTFLFYYLYPASTVLMYSMVLH